LGFQLGVFDLFSLNLQLLLLCVSIIVFYLASELSCVSLEFVLINSTIKVIDASIPLVDDDTASLSAFGLHVADWPVGRGRVLGVGPSP
jgi:hypothetical protein